MIRLLFIAGALTASLIAMAMPGFAQTDELPVVVIDLRKPMDQRLMDFVVDTLASTDAHLFVIQIDSPGISSGTPGPMYEAIQSASAPVVVWVGDRPAVAFGGAASLLNVADIGAAAPRTEIGYLAPTVAGNHDVSIPYRPSHQEDDSGDSSDGEASPNSDGEASPNSDGESSPNSDGEASLDALRDAPVVVEDPIPG